MGNCLRTNNTIAPDHEKHDEPPMEEEQTKSFTKPVLMKQVEGGHEEQKKKTVRFKLEEDLEDSNKSGVVRIKVVVTRKELKQIMNYKKDFKCSSVEQLVAVLKLRERRISAEARTSDDEDGMNSSWRPALESIPEDH